MADMIKFELNKGFKIFLKNFFSAITQYKITKILQKYQTYIPSKRLIQFTQ